MGSSAKVSSLTDSVLRECGGVISFRISVETRRWALVLRRLRRKYCCPGEMGDT